MSLTTLAALTFPKILMSILSASDIPPIIPTLFKALCNQTFFLLNYVSHIFHVIKYFSTDILVAVSFPIMPVSHNLFSHPFILVETGCFQSFAMINNVRAHVFVHKSFCTCVHAYFFSIHSRSGIPSSSSTRPEGVWDDLPLKPFTCTDMTYNVPLPVLRHSFKHSLCFPFS